MRSLTHHPRPREQTAIRQHDPTCASCSGAADPFSLPRIGHTATSYQTMPIRAISTGDHYRVEHELQPPIRRGASYHHLQG